MPDALYAGGGIGLGPRVEPVHVPYPVPEITSDDPVMFDVRPPVAELARDLIAEGWLVRITHARGRFPNTANGNPGRLKRSLCVRAIRRDLGMQVAAVYTEGATWTWGSLLVRKDGCGQASFSGITLFREAVLVHGG